MLHTDQICTVQALHWTPSTTVKHTRRVPMKKWCPACVMFLRSSILMTLKSSLLPFSNSVSFNKQMASSAAKFLTDWGLYFCWRLFLFLTGHFKKKRKKSCFFLNLKKKRKIRILEHWTVTTLMYDYYSRISRRWLKKNIHTSANPLNHTLQPYAE